MLFTLMHRHINMSVLPFISIKTCMYCFSVVLWLREFLIGQATWSFSRSIPVNSFQGWGIYFPWELSLRMFFFVYFVSLKSCIPKAAVGKETTDDQSIYSGQNSKKNAFSTLRWGFWLLLNCYRGGNKFSMSGNPLLKSLLPKLTLMRSGPKDY